MKPSSQSAPALSAADIARKLYRYDRTPTSSIPALDQIGEQELKQYQEQGYLVIDKVLNEHEVNQSIDALLDIIHTRTVGVKVQFTKKQDPTWSEEERELAVRKVYDYVGHEERLHRIAHHPAILQAMQLLLNEKPMLAQDQALLKPPFGGGEKPWHQDMAYGPLAYETQVIGIWIALDDAGLDNGCMHIIPRSHREGPVPHYAVRDWQLCDTSVHVERDVAVPLKPGGALIFSGLLHHGTPPNESSRRRRALQFHYAPESAAKLNPKEYKRMFTNALTKAEC